MKRKISHLSSETTDHLSENKIKMGKPEIKTVVSLHKKQNKDRYYKRKI